MITVPFVLIQRDSSIWNGKTLKLITTDYKGGLKYGGIVMKDMVVFHFTDGTALLLGIDRRGQDCYISEYIWQTS